LWHRNPRDAQRDKLKQIREQEATIDAMRGKSRGKHQPLMSINAKKLPGKTTSRKEIRLMAVTYAVARNSKPKECAKGAERPWSVTVSGEAPGGRALRVNR